MSLTVRLIGLLGVLVGVLALVTLSSIAFGSKSIPLSSQPITSRSATTA